MNLKVLGLQFASKCTILLDLEELLQTPVFCGKVHLTVDRIEHLIEKLNDEVSFVLEFPYIDKHYRDSYYCYHAAKFEDLARDCIRVHLFEGDIKNTKQLFSKSKPVEKKYLGFFIIRPLARFPLGRSLISPKALKDHNFVCCLTKGRVSLLGIDLTVYGFPHVAQDAETHSCAESSLWSIFEYFSAKYPQYNPHLPSQIVNDLTDFSIHRLLPSKGLTVPELIKCLQSNGHACLIYHKDESKDKFSPLIQIYIESGIPLLLALTEQGAGHAVLAIGHEMAPDYHVLEKQIWRDISFFPKKLILIDDNMPPYQIVDPAAPTKHYPNASLQKMTIQSFIVPLHRHMHLDAERAFSLVSSILDDKNVGLEAAGDKWLSRLFLTGSRSFKRALLNDELLNAKLKMLLVFMAYPRFIWVCELYKAGAFTKRICSGLLILDATGGNSLDSVLWYAVGNKRMVHDGSAWIENRCIQPAFVMETYQNNLKGEWNKWAS
jgi:hypothetical protein